MSSWPDGWREHTLRASGIPVSQFALDMLSAWQRSTPVIPQTYNPVGMPAKGTSNVAYLSTPYALFNGIQDFATYFKRFLSTSQGSELLHVLIAGDSPSDMWRAVHALKWPGNKTETDYPSVILDMMEESYRKKVQSRTANRRTTTGIVQAPPETHHAMRQNALMLHHAASNISDTSAAIRYLLRG